MIHPSANTTRETRLEIQGSEDSLKSLAKRYGINPKTAAKWRRRTTTADLPSGPKSGKHRRLTAEEVEIIVGFREHTQLPLDDCLYSLQTRIPQLTRSTLHRILSRHGLNRLPDAHESQSDGGVPLRPPLGYLHLDVTSVLTANDARYLFVAIDRASKFVCVRLSSQAGPAQAKAFLLDLAAALPFRIQAVLTGNLHPFVSRKGASAFARQARAIGIEQQVTTVPHRWAARTAQSLEPTPGPSTPSPGQSLTTAMVEHGLQDFVHLYNHQRRLKTLAGLTPHQYLCREWKRDSASFRQDPNHQIMELEFGSL